MVHATPFPSRVAEATAACRLDLAGGVLSTLPAAAQPAGALSVAVAVDRRAFARVEAGTRGVEIESKDSLLKLAVPNVASLSNEGVVGLVRRVLLGLDLETGLRVVTQARVPFAAGLASAGALAIAVAAAAARAAGRELRAEALAAFARHVDGGPGGERMEPAGALASVLGGVTAHPSPRGPARACERIRPVRRNACSSWIQPRGRWAGSHPRERVLWETGRRTGRSRGTPPVAWPRSRSSPDRRARLSRQTA